MVAVLPTQGSAGGSTRLEGEVSVGLDWFDCHPSFTERGSTFSMRARGTEVHTWRWASADANRHKVGGGRTIEWWCVVDIGTTVRFALATLQPALRRRQAPTVTPTVGHKGSS
jgi:hypothetical protein